MGVSLKKAQGKDTSKKRTEECKKSWRENAATVVRGGPSRRPEKGKAPFEVGLLGEGQKGSDGRIIGGTYSTGGKQGESRSAGGAQRTPKKKWAGVVPCHKKKESWRVHSYAKDHPRQGS